MRLTRQLAPAAGPEEFARRERRAALLAIALGILAIGTSLLVGYLSFDLSIRRGEERAKQFYLEKALLLREVAQLKRDAPASEVLETLQRIWAAGEPRPEDEYICIVDSESDLVLHTLAPKTVGNYAGDNPLLDAHGVVTGKLADLSGIEECYTGGYRASSGDEQIVAFASLPQGWTLGVHRSRERLREEIERTMVVLFLCFLLTCGVLFPASLGLLYHTYHRVLRGRRKATEVLQESEARFRNAITRAPMLALLHVEGGEVLAASEMLCTVAGHDLDDCPTMSDWGRALSGGKEPRPRPAEEDIGQTGEVTRHGENRYVTKDGVVRIWDASSAPVGTLPDGRRLVLNIAVDVSDRKRLEEQLRQSQKMEALGTLAGGVAHDFNNALYAILGFNELSMSVLPNDSEVQSYLQEVATAGQRAADLVAQILTFSRRREHERKPLPAQAELRELVRMLRASLPATVDIETVLDEDCGPVLADATEFQQVVMNVCTNAYQAMEATGGTLHIALSAVEAGGDAQAALEGLEPGAYARLTIRDTGPGMDEATLSRVFEPYFTTKESGHGTGLGLAIVHGVVRAIGGTILAESTPGKGSAFTIYLPLCPSGTVVPSDSEELPPASKGSGMVFIVDDEEAIANVQGLTLRRHGYRTRAFGSASEALDALQNGDERPDLLITDQTMPGMTGHELAREVLRIQPGLPILLCSGYSDVVSEDEAAKAGIQAFLRKPLEANRLLTAVRQALSRAGSGAGFRT